MAFVQECLPRRVELFCQTEEKKAEKFLAHNLSNLGHKHKPLKRVYSCKYFRLYYDEPNLYSFRGPARLCHIKHRKALTPRVAISISKRSYGLAVERNKIRRQIKSIFRARSLFALYGGVVLFSVFKPFGELSYIEASDKIESAVKSFCNDLKK